MSATRLTFYQTTIGKKVVMALSGVVLIGFVIVHMLGNLQILQELVAPGKGAAALNDYAAFLHSMPGVVWAARLVLLGAVAAHAWSGISLVRQNRAARPVAYARQECQATTMAARTMKWGGLTLLAFIVFHLLHLTCGSLPGFAPNMTADGRLDVYRNVVSGFQSPAVAGFYVVAQAFLAMHLYHGVWSMLQTLGLSRPRVNAWRVKAATAVALAVGVGNISIPVAVLAGLLK
jgi:succinate dehydrogenase / fumarate reductase cytochrome b subunit